MASAHYHYIITGAGCAGLSLLMRMMEEPFFADKRILVIDRSPKKQNDRTWCFWEKEAGLFEPVVCHQWQKVQFLSPAFSATLDLAPYTYKMIRGIDFYQFVIHKASRSASIEFRYEEVLELTNRGNQAAVVLPSGTVTADFIFNSIQFIQEQVRLLANKKYYHFLQHFKGWVIETNKPCFDASVARMMDFRISQQNGTGFMYVMPTSSTTALVEYTLFTESLLPKETYEAALVAYIANYLSISDYTVVHEEFGVIPMTNKKFELQNERIVNIGVAGGQVKGSSGYAFQFIQKRAAAIVMALMKGEKDFRSVSFQQKKGEFYDSVLLNVLHHKKMPGDKIFTAIFRKNKPGRVLRFLDNESTVLEDLGIMASVPTIIFLPAALQELLP